MTLKILHKRSTAVTGGVADAPAPADLEYGEIGINYADDDPALFIKDTADVIRRINLPAESNKKYSVANDSATLVGADATTAINAALVAAGDIADASDLGVSDQCEITDSGNPDFNAEVPVGRYWWDGAEWFQGGGGGGGGASVDVGDTLQLTHQRAISGGIAQLTAAVSTSITTTEIANSGWRPKPRRWWRNRRSTGRR